MEWHLDQYLTEEAWTHISISNLPNLFIPYNKINTPSGLVKAIAQLIKYGLLFVSESGFRIKRLHRYELRTLAERFGEIRTTFYGPVWDVVNGYHDGRDIAYSNLELGLHMDMSYVSFFARRVSIFNFLYRYFEHPPRYQKLHFLKIKL
jgi:hypothetical protein